MSLTERLGCLAVMAMLLAVLLGPRHGILVKFVRRQLLSMRILADDVVAVLYRIGESGAPAAARVEDLQRTLFCSSWSLRGVLAWLDRRGAIDRDAELIVLTDQGRLQAQHLVRSHRLWEQYLVEQADLPAERIHDKAELLEHITDRQMRDRLDEVTHGQLDPHGRPIPPENAE